ncbi:D-alanyl-D-alanine dipeptidase [Endozoicomonas numazuensis]|uniref:D-alanyl-D-alanine dipeptidase n=1 Tax=Endozoicomonas numazuensis TaxID=1137799 RepID=A0A081NFG5_9GAMM|nr:D-alanyl-D-alanine dipeptidase [Endozoicomonas numazuensis]KEQ17188.1 D-alanyl-D-alanine dipeptidase [Endozoicomonas numazuensis]
MKNTHSLVEITPQSHDVILEIAYATENNFTGKPIYKKPLCLMHEAAANKLQRAIEVLEPMGLKLKIWDAFRPQEAQQELYRCAPDPEYVSHPQTGVRPHCRGIAIDLTLIDPFGNELEMGTEFDDFRPLAHHGNDQVSDLAQKNRLILAGAMNVAGFNPIQSEWWHYQLPDADQYPVLKESDIDSGIK